MGVSVPICSHMSFMCNCVRPLSKHRTPQCSHRLPYLCVFVPVYSSVTCVLMSLHICEHVPVHLRKEPVWEPGQRSLAEEHHTLETDLGPCGQVGVGQK